MPDSPADANRPQRVWNVPNQVTVARIVLSLVLFALLSLQQYLPALAVFVLAAGTDWVDGYWARKYGQITKLGRVLDPFADKLIICGTFTYLAAAPRLADGSAASGVAAWMAVVILARELMVTALRAFVEGEGGDFSAKWAGKWKMVLQCAAACFSITVLSYLRRGGGEWADGPPPQWMTLGLQATVWAAIGLTIYSAVGYVRAAWSQIVGGTPAAGS
ncbi:MAG: CDP-diacylglycerol--glycerol-3-phosphate 3-phosphatidyltransferase [Planctomycetaceae bacterium]|nr:CDP-diacylglycerol--glycerol-3-phosphate 3-phosphatidyltransferase [Planctomycetaceae bacterium]